MDMHGIVVEEIPDRRQDRALRDLIDSGQEMADRLSEQTVSLSDGLHAIDYRAISQWHARLDRLRGLPRADAGEAIGRCEWCGIVDHHLIAGECEGCRDRARNVS